MTPDPPVLAASTQALIALCDAHLVRGDWPAALAAARAGVRKDRRDANAHYVLGGILGLTGALDAAQQSTREALRLDPLHAGAYSNLGAIATWRQDYPRAVAEFRRSLALNPEIQDSKSGLAYALLALGDFEQGWAQHERSRALGVLAYDKKEPVLWRGEAMPRGTLTLFGEAGLGDVLQFCRLAPLARERVGRVVLYLQSYYAPLAPLLATLEGIDEITLEASALRTSDASLSVLSLPYVFNASLRQSPAPVPYLHIDPARSDRWKARLRGLDRPARAGSAAQPALRVGLVWGGNPRLAQARISVLDRRRSIPFEALEPLLNVPGVEFHALQLGAAAAQLREAPLAARLVDMTGDIADFADTAALLGELDLLISVDTSVVHLAGALGRPVWMLNRFDSCWRWGSERDDASWYPSMRIFRQPRFGDWKPVIARVAEALREHAANATRVPTP